VVGPAVILQGCSSARIALDGRPRRPVLEFLRQPSLLHLASNCASEMGPFCRHATSSHLNHLVLLLGRLLRMKTASSSYGRDGRVLFGWLVLAEISIGFVNSVQGRGMDGWHPLQDD
jgi:hypothetical protein